MLELEHIDKAFHRGTPGEVRAVNELNLVIREQEFAVVIGFNGSGKTTLLNLVAGTYAPDRGKILIAGKDMTRLREYQRSKWIARIFQDPMAGTAPDLSIMDNFRLAALRTKNKSLRIGLGPGFRKKVKDRIASLNMGLENKTETLVAKLSGGQRQALTLLMAVMDDSRILLMDEPTASLDPRSSAIIIRMAADLIGSLKLTALLVTHDLNDAANYGTRLIMMKQGQIARDVSAEEKSRLKASDLVPWFT